MIKRRTAYTILSHVDLPDLQKDVQYMLGKGWQLQGGVTCGHIKTGGNTYDYKMRTEYCQALTKKVWSYK